VINGPVNEQRRWTISSVADVTQSVSNVTAAAVVTRHVLRFVSRSAVDCTSSSPHCRRRRRRRCLVALSCCHDDNGLVRFLSEQNAPVYLDHGAVTTFRRRDHPKKRKHRNG